MQRWTAIRERYDPERGDEYVFCELDENDHGDYVRFDDASTEIASLESKLAEAERTIAELRAYRDEEYARLLEWRGIASHSACRRCDGAGVRAYGSTATWRGGIGGQSFTSDVCDGCWGSGSRSAWPTWRNGVDVILRERDEARRVAVWAVKMCARMADSNKSLMWVWVDEEAYSVPCDGTDADIYRALREAMGESE